MPKKTKDIDGSDNRNNRQIWKNLYLHPSDRGELPIEERKTLTTLDFLKKEEIMSKVF